MFGKKEKQYKLTIYKDDTVDEIAILAKDEKEALKMVFDTCDLELEEKTRKGFRKIY